MTIVIQEEITITKKGVEDCIKHYEEMPSTFTMGVLSYTLNRDMIIKEIKELTELGKNILLMHYNFKKWEATFEKAN